MNENNPPLYTERIVEVTTRGVYRKGADGTKIMVNAESGSTTQTYVIYTKIN